MSTKGVNIASGAQSVMSFLKSLAPKRGAAGAFPAQLASIIEEQGIDLIFDVGGNVGQFAKMVFAAGYGGRLVSFEPGAEAHAKLSAAAKNNPNWTIAPRMALGKTRDVMTLHTFNRTDMNSLYAPDEKAFESFPQLEEASAEEVQVERLDAVAADFMTDADTVFLKIDTQGGELAILEGATGILDQLAMLQLEVAVEPVYRGEPVWMEVLAPVHDYGFRPALMSPGYFSKRIRRQLDLDIVFLRPSVEADQA
jgi:FkbM family methyltransferase